MKVEIIKQNLGDEVSYKYKPMSFCCDELARSPVIELVAGEYDATENYISEPQFCIADYDEWTEWEEDFKQDNYYQIKFCPFCGEKIEIEIIKEEDLRRKVRELENKLDYYNELRKYNEEV